MSQQINLFNPAFERKQQLFAAAPMTLALALLLAGVVGLGCYGKARLALLQDHEVSVARQLAKKQARLATVTAEFPPRRKDPALAAQLADAEAQLATLQKISGVLQRGELGDTRGFAEYFKALAREHVDGVWLTAVSVGGAGNDIGVRGRALDPSLLPGYLGRLTREPALQGKGFASVQVSQPAGNQASPYVEFSLQSGAEGGRP